jgi:hypothetical protein
MSQITPNFQFLPEPVNDPKTHQPIPWSSNLSRFARMMLTLWQNLAYVLKGQIGFGDGTNLDNINGFWATVPDTGLANTDFTITHNLGRIPVGYITMTASIATDIYTGSVSATKTQITLRSSAAHAAMSLFII